MTPTALFCLLLGIPLFAVGLYFVGWEIFYLEFGDFFIVGIIMMLIGGILVLSGIGHYKANIRSMKCYHHTDRDRIGICARCGKSLCEECLTELHGYTYCADCHKKLIEDHVDLSQIPLKSKTITILLCFFLWPIGLHRFYLGYSTSGIVYLISLMFALFLFIATPFPFLAPAVLFIEAVAAIIDLFSIACGKRKDTYGRKLI